MIKIKFNMDFHGEYIRNLEDLRNNFSVEDILEAYDNGLLVKWLDARRYTNELKQVKAIEAKNARGVLEELIRIFCSETEQEEIDENLALYDYLEERRKYREHFAANGLDELQALREECDTLKQDKNKKLVAALESLKKEREVLRQKQNENKKLKSELEVLEKENDNLKHQIECLKLSLSKAHSPSLLKATIPAGRSTTWICIRTTTTRCIIENIGNCGKMVEIGSAASEFRDVCRINEAIKEKRIFNGLYVRVMGGGFHSGLYFYYKEV